VKRLLESEFVRAKGVDEPQPDAAPLDPRPTDREAPKPREPAPASPAKPEPPAKKSNWVLAASALALIAAVVVGGALFMAGNPAPKPDTPPVVASAPTPAAETQQAEFDEAMAVGTVEKLDAFVAKNPNSALAKTAKRERERLREAGLALSQQVAPAAPPVASSPCGGVTLASVSSRAPAPLSAQEECASQAGAEFRECDTCQPMVVVPAGSFTMGSPEGEKERDGEGPQHEVRIAQPFAVGKFAVTFDEWDACVAGGGCNGHKPGDERWGRGRRPVINVSWNDAEAYVAWLRKKRASPIVY